MFRFINKMVILYNRKLVGFGNFLKVKPEYTGVSKIRKTYS